MPSEIDSRSYLFVVADAEAGERLDRYLVARQLPQTRSQLKRCIDGGCCLVNGQKARPAQRMKSGDSVVFSPPLPEPSMVLPEEIELSVLFEDDQLIVVDKPAGMVVHPAAGHRRGTLVGALLGHCEELSGVGGVLRPGIVHRLDKLTSGVMVASKTDFAHVHLAQQFKEHTIERRYQAIVVGHMKKPSGVFDTWHGRHSKDRKKFTSRGASGRRAVTHFRVLQEFKTSSLLELRLETGRTHQVRVHLADHGYPVLGDRQYGRLPSDDCLRQIARELGRQALHAHTLGFSHPKTEQRLKFAAPLPLDMQRAIDCLATKPGDKCGLKELP
ncbi:MAG: RluA family pseudouridine synthase [Pseudomonadota bacterium]